MMTVEPLPPEPPEGREPELFFFLSSFVTMYATISAETINATNTSMSVTSWFAIFNTSVEKKISHYNRAKPNALVDEQTQRARQHQKPKGSHKTHRSRGIRVPIFSERATSTNRRIVPRRHREQTLTATAPSTRRVRRPTRISCVLSPTFHEKGTAEKFADTHS